MFVITITGTHTGRTWKRAFSTLRRAEMHVRICRANFSYLTVSNPVHVAV